MIVTTEYGVIETFTEEELFAKYGYLMDKEHGKDIELLIDILKETGLEVEVKWKQWIMESILKSSIIETIIMNLRGYLLHITTLVQIQ